jgi:hypothetical protein
MRPAPLGQAVGGGGGGRGVEVGGTGVAVGVGEGVAVGVDVAVAVAVVVTVGADIIALIGPQAEDTRADSVQATKRANVVCIVLGILATPDTDQGLAGVPLVNLGGMNHSYLTFCRRFACDSPTSYDHCHEDTPMGQRNAVALKLGSGIVSRIVDLAALLDIDNTLLDNDFVWRASIESASS